YHTAAGSDADDDTCVCAGASVCPDGTYMDSTYYCVCNPCQGQQVSSTDKTSCVCPSNLGDCVPAAYSHVGTDCHCGCADGSTLITTNDDSQQHCVPATACPNSQEDCYWDNGNPYQPEDP